jgi:hypothetical protein
VRTINEHLMNIFAEGELSREATIRKFRIARWEGERNVTREVEYYNLEAIISVNLNEGRCSRNWYWEIWLASGQSRSDAPASRMNVEELLKLEQQTQSGRIRDRRRF